MTANFQHYMTGSSLTMVSMLWPFLKTVTVTVLRNGQSVDTVVKLDPVM